MNFLRKLKQILYDLRLVVHVLRSRKDPVLRSLMERSRLSAKQGDADLAADLAREVWRRGRENKFVGIWCGQMLARFGQPEEAAGIYCATEGLAPGDWEAYWTLGRYLWRAAGDRVRAVEYLREAVRIEPRAIDAHLDLARCLRQMGRKDEADAQLVEACRLDPDDVTS